MLRTTTTTTGDRTLHQTDERAGNEYQKAEGNTSLQDRERGGGENGYNGHRREMGMNGGCEWGHMADNARARAVLRSGERARPRCACKRSLHSRCAAVARSFPLAVFPRACWITGPGRVK